MTTDDTTAAPHWFVTFSDMLSLLLTFFVMIVSFSDLKSEEKYEALMEGFHQQFGSQGHSETWRPGALRPRNSQLARLVVNYRQQRFSESDGQLQTIATQGDMSIGSNVAQTPRMVLGTVLYFQEDQIELDGHQLAQLQRCAAGWHGRPVRLQILGHTAQRPATRGTQIRDSWDLSFERCRRVMEHLVHEQHVNSRNLQLTTVGSEAVGEAKPTAAAPRVELWLLEPAADLSGNLTERL